MNKIIFIILAFLLANSAFSQKTEYSVNLTSGFFFYRSLSQWNEGETEHITKISGPIHSMDGLTGNPFGNKTHRPFGISIGLNKVQKNNIIFGLDAYYESLSTSTKIIFAGNDVGWGSFVQEGKSILTNQYINLRPFFGKRVDLSKDFKLDLKLGAEIAYCFKSIEESNFSTEFATYSYKYDHPSLFDYRFSMLLSFYYKNIGLTIGYSNGYINYVETYPFGNTEYAYSRMFRFELSYKFEKFK